MLIKYWLHKLISVVCIHRAVTVTRFPNHTFFFFKHNCLLALLLFPRCHGNQQPGDKLLLIKSGNTHRPPPLPSPEHTVVCPSPLQPEDRMPWPSSCKYLECKCPGAGPSPRWGGLRLPPGPGAASSGVSQEDLPLADVCPRRPHILFAGESQVQKFPLPPTGIVVVFLSLCSQ